MKRILKSLGATLLGLAWSVPLFAGTTNFNFMVDPTTLYNADGSPTFTFAGAHNWNNPSGASYIWSATNGQAGAADGYLSIVDNVANQSLVAVLPALDPTNAPIAAFTLEMDLRVGNPTNANSRPADGFSISFARLADLVLSNAVPVALGGPGQAYGFAGGGSLWGGQATSPGNNMLEAGTKSGIAFSFDAYEGAWLPDGATNASGTTDKEGVAVRVDDSTLLQFPLPNRNGNCSNSTCFASARDDVNSLQTGPFMGTTNVSGTTYLGWQHLKIQLTNNLITVVWKGRTIVSTNYPYWAPTAGRFILAGRNGGNCENVHVDNLSLTTYPSANSYVQNVAGTATGFKFNLADYGDHVASVTQVLLDNQDVTALTAISSAAPLTAGTLTLPTNLVSYSKHTAAIIWQTDTGLTLAATNLVITPVYTPIPTSGMVALSDIDTTQPGVLVNAWQTRQNNPNGLAWTEQQVVGLRGANVAGSPLVPRQNGFLVWEKEIDFVAGSTGPGYFPNNNDLNNFGIGTGYSPTAPNGAYDNCAVELFGYIYFPTSGFYNFVIGNDDSYQLTFSQSPFDRMGTVINSYQGSRLMTTANPPVGTDVKTIYIPQPGCYPFRLFYENGGGAGGLEWYTYDPNNATTPYILVNDPSNPAALRTYRATLSTAAAQPYVKKALPVRNDPYVIFSQPVVVDLADGTGNLAVDANTISLKVDGNPQGVTLTKSGDTSHLVQQLTNYWTTTTHTTLLSFNDLNGTNYTYSWQFTVMGGALAPTNSAGPTNNIFTLPLASRVDHSTLRQPGFRVRSHQMYFKQANSIGTAEEQFEGLHGPNLAFQFSTNGPGFFVWNDVLDFRKASGTGTGGAGTFNTDFDFSTFGMTPLQQTSSQNNVDNCALDVGVWLDFPIAGIYIVHVNTDDGFYLTVPSANEPFSKLGTVVAINDGGRGVAAEVTSGVAGGSYAVINVPAPGGYPFRLLYENGTSDAAVEWSIYQPLADGTVAKVAVNDPANPQSIKAYQVSTTGSGPFVSYANPAPYAKDIVFYQPIVVDLADGPTLTTSPSQIDSLTVNGVQQTFTATKPPGTTTTHILQNLATAWAPNMNHTNVLVYHDSAGNSYSNYWVFTTLNISPFGIVQLPATNAVPLSALDLSQPGFRVKPYQVTTNTLGNTIAGWEGVLEGLGGANIADLSATNGPGFFATTSIMDFNNAVTGGNNSGGGEWEWDLPLTTFGIQPNTVGSSGNVNNLMNYCALDIGTYLYFPKAGTFIMEINTDDDFRLTSPYGNPFNKYGVYLSAVENGHGAANAGFGPRTGTVYVSFNVPTPGAYPFRLLFANITGGAAMEWSIFEYLADGSVAQVLLGDTNSPGTIQAYQVSTQDTPYVAYVSPVPGNIYGPNQPTLTLAGNNAASTLTNSGPVQGTDIVFALANGQTSVNTNTLTLSLNGYVQPIIITNDANGYTWVVRPANAAQWWPSGQAGTLMVNFQDNTGRTINMPLTTIATPFWGTLSNGLPLGRGDANKPGFLVRTYAVNQAGSVSLPTRVHTAEQVLAGIWGPNVLGTSAYGTTLSNGYSILQGAGRTAGVINFNPGGGNIGDFQTPNTVDQLLPGLPATDTTAGYRTNSFASEFLAYVEFPTAGTYTLGVNSDDGFRLTQGFNPPANNGALMVNSPAVLAGAKATVQDTYLASYSLTNFVTGNLVLVQGPYAGGNPPNLYGSTNYNGKGYSVDGCMISNGAQLAGNIALIYRSTSCGFAQQVQNAAAAGAIAVVFVQNRPSSEGWFPTEAGVTPMQPIPAVMISLTDGLNLIAAMATNTVNVTLTPMDSLVNPAPELSPLGQADVGKGSSDVLFPVVVPQPGVYPLRLVWFQGGGGANVEFFSVTNGTRVLINDLGNTAAPALKAYYGIAQPTVKISSDGTTLTVTFTGTLQVSTDLKTWSDVSGSSPLSFPISSSSPLQFFRARY